MIQDVSGTHMLPAIEFAESEEFKISDEYNYTGHDKWKMVTDKQVLFFFRKYIRFKKPEILYLFGQTKSRNIKENNKQKKNK